MSLVSGVSEPLERADHGELDLVALGCCDACLISVSGEIDAASSPQLAAALEREIRSGSRSILIDLTDVGYLDASGLEVLDAARRRLDGATASLYVIGASELQVRLFAITSLDEGIVIHEFRTPNRV